MKANRLRKSIGIACALLFISPAFYYASKGDYWSQFLLGMMGICVVMLGIIWGLLGFGNDKK